MGRFQVLAIHRDPRIDLADKACKELHLWISWSTYYLPAVLQTKVKRSQLAKTRLEVIQNSRILLLIFQLGQLLWSCHCCVPKVKAWYPLLIPKLRKLAALSWFQIFAQRRHHPRICEGGWLYEGPYMSPVLNWTSQTYLGPHYWDMTSSKTHYLPGIQNCCWRCYQTTKMFSKYPRVQVWHFETFIQIYVFRPIFLKTARLSNQERKKHIPMFVHGSHNLMG